MESSNGVVEPSEIDEITIPPDDIVEKFLSMLPVTSLFRFRCASKSWCSLIGSNHFIQRHLENLRKNSTFAHHRIIMLADDFSSHPYDSLGHDFSSHPYDSLRHFSMRCLMNQPSARTYAFDDPFMHTWEDSYRIVGCCDGLICFMCLENEFFLWNPTTRQSSKLPDVNVKDYYIVRCGLGYDKTNGDYKVLAVLESETEQNNKNEGRIYSLKSNSWKRIRMPEMYGMKDALEGLFLNGKLHWLRLNYPKWEAVWFDLENEKHGMVELPRFALGSMAHKICPLLVEIAGCLGVLWVHPRSGIDVWIMKEYGVKESWSKVRTISCDWETWEWESLSSKLLFVGESGDFFFICRCKLLVYGLKNCVLRQRPHIIRYPHVYMESLVSPFPGQ